MDLNYVNMYKFGFIFQNDPQMLENQVNESQSRVVPPSFA